MTIREVALQYHLTADTLRYYERIGLIPSVHRKTSGVRDYTPADCEWIQFIKCMRSAGLPIEALIHYVTLYQKGTSTLKARKEILLKQRHLLKARIDEMQATLSRLDQKIDTYEDGAPEKEEEVL